MRLRRPVVPLLAAAALVAPLAGCRFATSPDERIYTLEIAPARVACTGLIPQQCLQVRERPDEPFTLFYDSIRGFTYEPGFTYRIRVGERRIANPPADGSSLAYRLVALLSKTPA